jgi:hypothetical protein
MRIARLLLVLALAAATLGFAKKAAITVRFHVEGAEQDGQPFVMPATFHNPERKGFVATVPAISERNIKSIFPYPAPDGSMGCAFKLDAFGRNSLEQLSIASRGASLVVFVGTKNGTHQVIDMIIDKTVRDGIINIPRGLTALEVAALEKEFRVMGQTKKKGRTPPPE